MRPTHAATEMSVQGEHVIGFMRRQADFDALKVASGVIFTVARVIKESSQYRDESRLLGEIAAKIHNIGRRLCGAEQRERQGSQGPIPNRVDTSR